MTARPFQALARIAGRLCACAASVVLALPCALAQAPAAAPSPTPAAATPPAAAIPAEELEALVGRIALYPDDLIAIILPASTNPLQVVQADRYLTKRKTDPKAPVDESWDDSVKSLLNYPEVVTSMSADLDWTAALGEAVVADQGDVLDAIQAFRRKTQSAGNLKSDEKQVVVVEKEIIKIEPADPQVIYVPQYNPSSVTVYGGYSAYGYYPSPYPVYYYPYAPAAAFTAGLIWGAAISSAWNGHHVAHYGGNANININRNTNINTGDVNVGNRANTGNRGGATSTAWKPNKQPGQVSKSVGAKAPARVGDSSRAAGGAGAARPSNQPSTGGRGGAGGAGGVGGAGGAGGVGGAGGAGGVGGAGGGAFDGYGSGHQARQDSSRGASSRSAATQPSRSAAPTRSAPARSGGGGGGGRGRR